MRSSIRKAPALMGAALAAMMAFPSAAETVKGGMPIPVTLTDLGYYAFGEELGFYKEDGINLRIIVFKGSGKMVPQVATKKLDIGWALPGAKLFSVLPIFISRLFPPKEYDFDTDPPATSVA